MKFEISKLKEYLETIDKIKNLSLRGWIDTEFADNIAELTKLELEDYIKAAPRELPGSASVQLIPRALFLSFLFLPVCWIRIYRFLPFLLPVF